jgi:hypothetical protein
MHSRTVVYILLGAALLWAAACSPIIIPEPAADTPSPQQPAAPRAPVATPAEEEEETMRQDITPQEPAQPQAQDEYTAEMTSLAVDDLAQHLDIPADQIEVREVRAVTWPDASLGCPQPDMMYAQVLTDGLLIQLEAGGELYFYHSGGNQLPFLCEGTLRMEPLPKEDEFVPPPEPKLDTPETE